MRMNGPLSSDFFLISLFSSSSRKPKEKSYEQTQSSILLCAPSGDCVATGDLDPVVMRPITPIGTLSMYLVIIHVVPNLLLTPKQWLHFCTWA